MSNKQNKILLFDPQIAGISGDMILAALLDLGADIPAVTAAMKIPHNVLPGCRSIDISITDVIKKGIKAKRVDIKIDEKITITTAASLMECLSECLQQLNISDRAKKFSVNALTLLVTTEAKVHGQNIKETHLHEIASADTFIDIIGSATALDNLGLLTKTNVFSTPISVGGGIIQFSHGKFPVPAPVAQEIIQDRRLLMVGGPVDTELATPTGVALLATLSPESTHFYPPMRPNKTGYGAGTKEFNEMPNILKLTIGDPISFNSSFDSIYVIETNIDDATGEVMGYAMERLLEEGAKDVSFIPMFTKKGRPGYIIRILTDDANREWLSHVLIEETGTLGVRMYQCERRILHREMLPIVISIGKKRGRIQVKVSRTLDGQILQIKPEYDDVQRLADKTGKSFREIEQQSLRKAEDTLKNNKHNN